MIAVIFLFQLPQRFLFSHFLRNGKPFYIFMHLLQHFFLSDTTNGSVWFQHTDIRDIVQSAGHAELRELGDTGQENKAQIRVACLQRTVKITYHITKYGEILFLMQHIQQERVILVNENYHLPARLLIGTLYQVCQLDVNLRIIVFRQAIFPIIFPQLPDQILIQFLLVQMFGQAHIKV